MVDALFKLTLFGNGGVGKTSLVTRYLRGVFNDKTAMTIGVDFHTKKIKIGDMIVSLQIWDFAGEDRFRFLLPSYLRGANGGIFMYDITRFSSIKDFDAWLDVLRTEAEKEVRDIPIMLVGGKSDLENKRVITKEEGRKLMEEKGLCDFFECSAKTGENVEKIFKSITKTMLERAGMLQVKH
ncbi:MAG: Rab family GTPase [Promethearchaeia archaeon]